MGQTTVGAGGIPAEIDIELLKLMAAVLALVVSTVTIQFKVAEFVNKKRDEFPKRPVGWLPTVSEVFDWSWGYALAIAINAFFAHISRYLVDELRQEGLDKFLVIGKFLYWGYVGNTAFWVIGMGIDFFRLILPAKKRSQA